MRRGDHEAAAEAYELIRRMRGCTHSESSVLDICLAVARQKQGDASGVAKVLAASPSRPHRWSALGDLLAADVAESQSSSVLALRLQEVVPVKPQPKRLVVLCISGLHLSSLPDSLFDLRRLQRLDTSRNRLVSLPEDMAKLKSLKELDVSSNELMGLPDALAVLPQLVVLALQNNRFGALPPVALRCRRLHELKWGAQKRSALYLSAHQCAHSASTSFQMQMPALATTSTLPASAVAEPAPGAQGHEPAMASTQLVTFEMEANGVTSLPRLNQSNPYLRTLLASFNQLPAVPPAVISLGPSLRKLHLGCNRIRCVGEALPQLANLTELKLEGNLLQALPASIGMLTKLREFWVHGNELLSLPEELGRCKSLTVLQAHHNKLTDLPDAMRSLSHLQGLYLQSNRLSDLQRLRSRILEGLPLQNLALGFNDFDLSQAFCLAESRVGLGWNCRGGDPPAHLPRLSDRFAVCDHLFDPASAGGHGDVLLVALASQGPGVQQWHGATAALRAAGISLDVLYVADPSNSFYLQDPTGGWNGIDYFHALITRYSRPYLGRILLVGSSMGATACLQHARLGARALAFAPRIDLDLSHGAFVPRAARDACRETILSSITQCASAAATAAAASSSCEAAIAAPVVVTVHVGASNHVDLAQVECMRNLSGVHVVEHATFHHNVPQFLEGNGDLVPLVKDEILTLMRDSLSYWLSTDGATNEQTAIDSCPSSSHATFFVRSSFSRASP